MLLYKCSFSDKPTVEYRNIARLQELNALNGKGIDQKMLVIVESEGDLDMWVIEMNINEGYADPYTNGLLELSRYYSEQHEGQKIKVKTFFELE